MTDTRKEYQDWLDKCPLTLFGGEFQVSEMSWQACQQLNNTRIADLEATIRNMAAVIELQRKPLADMVGMMDSGDEHGFGSPWHKSATEALALTADGVELVEVTHLKFRAVLYGGNHEHGPESHEWLEQCSKGDVGDDGLEAFPVYTIKQKP